MRHGRDCPDRCSQCLQAAGELAVPVQRVAISPGALHDVPLREYQQRGGRRGGPARARSISQAFDTSDTKENKNDA